MNMLRGIGLFVLGIGVVVAGIVAYQVWGQPATNGQAANTEARNQFLSDRGGTAPITGTTGLAGQAGPGGGFPGAGFPGVAGTVASVARDTLKVTSLLDNSTVTVRLAADAPINKQVSGQASDITVGEQILATGSQTGATLTADRIQLGATDGLGFDGFGGGFGGGMGRPGANGTPGARAQRTPGPNETPFARPQRPPGANGTPGAMPGGAGFNGVRGAVTAVNGTTITVQNSDGSTTTVELGATTQILRRQAITLAEVQAGDTVRATGSQAGDIFEATALQVGELAMMGGARP